MDENETAVSAPATDSPARAKRKAMGARRASSISLVMLAIISIIGGFIYGMVRNAKINSRMTVIFWDIEDTRKAARDIFDESYYKPEAERAKATARLEQLESNLDDDKKSIVSLQVRFRLQDSEDMRHLEEMYVGAQNIIDAYINNLGPRDMAAMHLVKEYEAEILRKYYDHRNRLAKDIGIIDEAKLRAMMREMDKGQDK